MVGLESMKLQVTSSCLRIPPKNNRAKHTSPYIAQLIRKNALTCLCSSSSVGGGVWV